MDSENTRLLRELESETCWCGSAKKRNQTFCQRCYFRLPAGMRKALYRRLGSGYAEAVEQAKIELQASGVN